MTFPQTTDLARRNLLRGALLCGAAGLLPISQSKAFAVNDTLGVGIIGAGGRGNELAGPFHAAEGAKVVAAADPDADRAEKLAGKYGATAYTDLRRLLADPAVDVVAIATCNHWHCLAAIMAMEAGKDVYVEKPLSHTQWEGRQVVSAARKYDRIVQLGTQQRSDPMQAELKKFLHQDQALGEIEYVQASRLGVRGQIGRRQEPLKISSSVNYDLWVGPAKEQPLFRDRLHYDWHWDFNTGSGEMGNWGVHVLDDVRNVAYQDAVSTPSKIMAIGGRLAWNDAGNTPNVHYAIFETPTFPTLIALSNLSTQPDGKPSSWWSKPAERVKSPGSGYVVACQGGFLLGQRQYAKAVDRDGKTIREFRGKNIVPLHVNNFLDAVRSRDRGSLNAEIAVGHDSTGWCNLANVGFQAATSHYVEEPGGIQIPAAWSRLMNELDQQLVPFGASRSDLLAGPVLTHNPKTEQFEGSGAEQANRLLRREYRDGFQLAEITS